MNKLTTLKASELIGISPSHLRRLLKEEIIRGEKFGRDWLIEEHNIKKYQRLRKPKTSRKDKSRY